MSLLRYAMLGNMKRFLGNVKEVAKKEKMSGFVVFNKFLLCFARTGCGYSDYMNYKLYKRSWAEIDEYVTIKAKSAPSSSCTYTMRRCTPEPVGMVRESASFTPALERATTLWPMLIPGPKLV